MSKGGGTWNYGTTLDGVYKGCYSDYIHPTKKRHPHAGDRRRHRPGRQGAVEGEGVRTSRGVTSPARTKARPPRGDRAAS
ncbi:lactococcin 972 family bacteriocin [Streptomyces sp. JB150]|uniref:lactococcin 972 family bacteriocin n=1 Tax=Streptomyces sp. JB150 TaxID=2714844 RepID=UPI001F0E0360|nr:lactococcin 972 family bacteriocin [Streptomyces sp. JB150]